jgi:hypothetical protein
MSLVNFKRNIRKRGSPKLNFSFTEPIPDYIQGVVDTCLKIHKNLPGGDILAFLTGQEEVDRAVSLLNDHASADKGKCTRTKGFKNLLYLKISFIFSENASSAHVWLSAKCRPVDSVSIRPGGPPKNCDCHKHSRNVSHHSRHCLW